MSESAVDVVCDADDCRNNVAGRCGTNIRVKRGMCQQYAINMKYLKEKWRHIRGKESVSTRASPAFTDKSDIGE